MTIYREIDRCGMCGGELPGSLDDDPARRAGCPFCGSTHRRAGVSMTAEVTGHGQVTFKGRRRGVRKPFIEGKWGEDLHRASGVWNLLRRVIDRENDRYVEKIDAPDGTIVRDVDEPLSDHRGHGSARKRREKP